VALPIPLPLVWPEGGLADDGFAAGGFAADGFAAGGCAAGCFTAGVFAVGGIAAVGLAPGGLEAGRPGADGLANELVTDALGAYVLATSASSNAGASGACERDTGATTAAAAT
jgi:hypothetical protein